MGKLISLCLNYLICKMEITEATWLFTAYMMCVINVSYYHFIIISIVIMSSKQLKNFGKDKWRNVLSYTFYFRILELSLYSPLIIDEGTGSGRQKIFLKIMLSPFLLLLIQSSTSRWKWLFFVKEKLKFHIYIHIILSNFTA